METFEITVWKEFGPAALQVRKTGLLIEEDLIDYEVFDHNWFTKITIDASRWFPPFSLGDEPVIHTPQAFTFCHDGKLTYAEAQCLGHIILRETDRQLLVLESQSR